MSIASRGRPLIIDRIMEFLGKNPLDNPERPPDSGWAFDELMLACRLHNEKKAAVQVALKTAERRGLLERLERSGNRVSYRLSRAGGKARP
jgi:hypothetical protein